MSETIYEYATKAWPVALGCSPSMRCAPRCWAKKTVNRLAHSDKPAVRAAHEGLVREVCEQVSAEARVLPTKLHWSGVTRLNEAHLTDPLRWRKPQIVADGYHGDLFRLPFEQIDRVFAVMALCPQHTFLTLTKCPERMREYCSGLVFERLRAWMNRSVDGSDNPPNLTTIAHAAKEGTKWQFYRQPIAKPFVIPNLWLGVSCEDQAAADERIPLLLQTPAAKRWVSLEPCIGPVDLSPYLTGKEEHGIDLSRRAGAKVGCCIGWTPALDWTVVGGESGSQARPFDIQWARDIVRQCREAGVPCFVKQLGARPIADYYCGDDEQEYACGQPMALNDPKGADPSEWPEDLQVREVPTVKDSLTGVQ